MNQNNAVRLQLHALAYNPGNFMRTLALPEAVPQRIGNETCTCLKPHSSWPAQFAAKQ